MYAERNPLFRWLRFSNLLFSNYLLELTMFSKTLGISLMAGAWMLAFAGIFIWSLEAPFGDFWHMDHLSVLATIANAVFITALVCFDECFGIA